MTERSYLNLIRDILQNGEPRQTRNGVRLTQFGAQMRFDLKRGFPLLTTKKMHWKSVVVELLWIISGSTNVRWMQNRGVTIWDEWADADGDLGPVYGKQWRDWDGEHYRIDQLAEVIQQIKDDPFSTRHIVSAWNPEQVDDMALPPCHTLFQFDVNGAGELSCALYQRSADMFLGVPFNIASYALLTFMVAAECGLKVGQFVHTLGNAHIYENHRDAVTEQLKRKPRPFPHLAWIGPLDSQDWTQFKLTGYNPWPSIRAPVSK